MSFKPPVLNLPIAAWAKSSNMLQNICGFTNEHIMYIRNSSLCEKIVVSLSVILVACVRWFLSIILAPWGTSRTEGMKYFI